MQGSGWLSVLGKIPPQKHDNLAIVTNTGAEIVLREIVRVENDFIIIRGRMAGSTDGGRVIILPFDQITYLAFNKMLPEAEIHAMFSQGGTAGEVKKVATAPEAAPATGQAPASRAAEAAAPGAAPAKAAQGTDAPPAVAAAAAPAGGKGPAKPSHPSKSVLLARLRARLSNESDGSMPGGGSMQR